VLLASSYPDISHEACSRRRELPLSFITGCTGTGSGAEIRTATVCAIHTGTGRWINISEPSFYHHFTADFVLFDL
jgi:hypothetical protein